MTGDFDNEAEYPFLPNILRQSTFSIPEHQVLLSFNGDDDATTFYEWWSQHGEDDYIKWVTSEETSD